MATVTANKMSSLISKGKLPAIEVARLIHQHHVEGFSGREPTGFIEAELKKLASNLNHREWVGVSHWVEEGIDLLYGFAMNIKSDAALAAANLNMVNSYLIKMRHADQGNELHLDPNNWQDIHSSMEANILRVLWYYEALLVVNRHMKAEWSSIVSMGMQSMRFAIGLINETLDSSGFATFEVDRLKPSEEVIDGWGQKLGTGDVRGFLLDVVEGEVVG